MKVYKITVYAAFQDAHETTVREVSSACHRAVCDGLESEVFYTTDVEKTVAYPDPTAEAFDADIDKWQDRALEELRQL
jgi:hypothetical protein